MSPLARDDTVTLRIDAGPDAGRTIAPGLEPLVLGRAPGRGRIGDPFLEAHHLLVRAAAREVVQLAGRVVARVDGVPVGRGTAIRGGSVIEIGASRIVVATRDDSTRTVDRVRHRVVLGVGPRAGTVGRIGDADVSFVRMAAADERARRVAPVTIDVRTIRRLLVTGPSAEGLVRSIAHQVTGRGLVVCRAVSELGRSAPPGTLVVAVDDDPEAGWSGGELPTDGAVIDVGASWAATLTTRTPDGASAVRRFHAAGLAAGRLRLTARRPGSGPDRPLVAQQVARAGAELGGDVVGVPQPARRQ